jgi:glyoxylase-like metal-dependent hydrolase (beta-lactamase superfamily II)
MAKAFASTADMTDKKATFEELAKGVYAYTTEGDPNTGVIIGDKSVMVIDARATPVLAEEFIAEIRNVTDLPIEHLILTHYHAVRVLGASAYNARYIIGHKNMRQLVLERGQQDWESETGRFPRLFRSAETIPGLTMPNVTFDTSLTYYLGDKEVQLLYLGKGHTSGDAAVFLPKERILFSGDLVEAGAAPYAGDAYIEEWLTTLERVRALNASALVPGRGDAVRGKAVDEAISSTKAFLKTLYDSVFEAVRKEASLKQAYDAAYAALKPQFGSWAIFEHCMPFDVSRVYDEISGTRPRIWTATRDIEMWKSLQSE